MADVREAQRVQHRLRLPWGKDAVDRRGDGEGFAFAQRRPVFVVVVPEAGQHLQAERGRGDALELLLSLLQQLAVARRQCIKAGERLDDAGVFLPVPVFEIEAACQQRGIALDPVGDMFEAARQPVFLILRGQEADQMEFGDTRIVVQQADDIFDAIALPQ